MMKKKRKINSLYIHIPFCKKICPYCDFVKFVNNEYFEEKYIFQLLNDLKKIKQKFKTIYIGGGTPSIFKLENIEKLLIEVKKHLYINHELTFECNPEDISIDLLKLLKKYHVNRISLGIQSFNKTILKNINRDYDIDYFSLIRTIKKFINNINVDFIYGFQGQTIEDLKSDLDNFIKLDVNHISIYSLIVDEGSIFYLKRYSEQDEDESRIFYDYILNFLRKNGFIRYEVSNFARKKKFSSHNLNYWNDEYYLGIGLGASGFIETGRYTFNKSLNKYLDGKREFDLEKPNFNKEIEYFLLTNLRKEEGFKISNFNKRFNLDFNFFFKNEIKHLINNKYVEIVNNYFRCTDEGLIILDRIILKLIENL